MTDKPSDQPEAFDLNSEDVTSRKIAELEQLLPEAFVEGRVDFDELRRALGSWVEEGSERYGLSWPGKAACMKVIQASATGALRPDRAESVDFDKSENVFIEGDNLEVLKLLQKAYFEKVSLIYIDPPYNTGGEFIYPDRYAENLDTYLAYTGQVDDKGRRFSTNAEDSGRLHSRWLSMMYPRLYLARNLLTESGLIFISINDVEYANLKLLCDQIFGSENFVANFIWKSRQNKDNRPEKGASVDHEYILCYGKRVRGDERKIEQYTNPDDDPRGPWASANMVGLATKDRRPNLHYNLIHEETGVDYGCPDMGWRYDPQTMKRLIVEDRILWPASPDGRPRRKAFLADLGSEFTGISSVIGNDVYTRNGTAEVKELFDYRAMDFPKPTELLREVINQSLVDGGIVLDFFAGSGSTAHALLANQVAGNSIGTKFVLVQLPEPIEGGTEAYSDGLRTIAALGRKRIRLAAQELKNETDSRANIDFGFRAFALAPSAFSKWDARSDETQDDLLTKLQEHAQHRLDAADDDILFEVLLKDGFALSTKVERRTLGGSEVYSIADGALLICLERNLTKETIDALADLAEDSDAARVVCLDAGFQGNDQLKANAVQTFKSRLGHGEDGSMFRTV